MLPLRYKSWVVNKRLSHAVTDTPSEITGKEDSIRVLQFDDKKIILNVSKWRFTALIWMALFLLAANMFYKEATGEIIFVVIGFLIVFTFLILALVSLAWFVFQKKKYVVFDRDKGTVSVPGPFWYKNIEISFDDVVAVIRKETYYYAHLNVLNIYRPDGYKADVGINTHDLNELKRDWAFYVWYMDKSRPLPPAPVFDKYRQTSSFKSVLGNVS